MEMHHNMMQLFNIKNLVLNRNLALISTFEALLDYILPVLTEELYHGKLTAEDQVLMFMLYILYIANKDSYSIFKYGPV